MKTTKEIETHYGVTRQTLHNWINSGLISSPTKDWRGWFQWDECNEMEINSLKKLKEIENNVPVIETKNNSLKLINRRYLGSKQKMLNFIETTVLNNTMDIRTVADIFAGTGAVADIFRARGKKVIVNDILRSNYISYLTWFGNTEVDYKKIEKYISELNSLQANEDNYVSKNFGDKYFSMENARKIGSIRAKIEDYEDLNEREKAFLLTSLLYAMDKVANTVGHYDAFRQKMDSLRPILLKVPELNKNVNNDIFCMDANSLVREIEADLVYIDTPYNSRQYGDAYHLLENIVEWKQPDVVGVARKMINRQHIKSEYSTKKAPDAFDDLIQNIKAKYILVSYNNMAQKGNGRSNAKISNEEIIASLEKRGDVQVFETPFQFFTTGKTKIEDHKELLYLCTIRQKKSKQKGALDKLYIRSAINYTGGKYKLLPQLLSLFPQTYTNFIDIFAGGANVGVNANPQEQIVLNDLEPRVIEFYKLLSITSYENVLDKINSIILKYELSNSKTNGYEYYGVQSGSGLSDYNRVPYMKLRSDYNSGLFDEDEMKPIVFYVLTVFAFNNQIRFNRNGGYNLPVGKRDFNVRMEKKLQEFHQALSNKSFSFSSKDFREFKDIQPTDFVYLDPPYLISTASYNENGGWGIKDETDLLRFLDDLNDAGVKWALSNVLYHKGHENRLLMEWSKKYYINELNFHYNNSNYQSKAKNNFTQEVLITNYYK